MDLYLSGKFYAEKLSLKILKNAKTASTFVFLTLKGYFLTYQFMKNFNRKLSFFLKRFFSWFFLNCCGGSSIWKS